MSAFQSLKCEHVYRPQFEPGLDLLSEAETFRIKFNRSDHMKS